MTKMFFYIIFWHAFGLLRTLMMMMMYCIYLFDCISVIDNTTLKYVQCYNAIV